MLVAINFSILAEIPSDPVDLDMSRVAKRSNTSSSEQRISAAGESRKWTEGDNYWSMRLVEA